MTKNNYIQLAMIQQNIARCKVALFQLFAYLTDNDIHAALIQEPYTINQSVPCAPGYTVVHANVERPRSAIILSNQVSAFAIHLEQFSSQDICVCEIRPKSTVLLLVSVYLPPGDSVCEQLDLLQNIAMNNDKIIIGGDFNAHHQLWGSRTRSPRGNEVCDLINASRAKVPMKIFHRKIHSEMGQIPMKISDEEFI